MTVDKLEHLKSQLDLTTYSDLISQLEELILKFEPLDSACSSRRSSISSHVGIFTFQRVYLYSKTFLPQVVLLYLLRSQSLSSFHVIDLERGESCQEGAFFQPLGSPMKPPLRYVLEPYFVSSLFIIFCFSTSCSFQHKLSCS